jgi:RNA polymerase sigma factor (sigma-70 family)
LSQARAKDKLVRSFHRLVLKIASEYFGPARDDLIGAGVLGFWEAINRFDLRRNNRLGAFAEWWIRKRVRLAVREWRRGGQAGETRADRFVYSNRCNARASSIEGWLHCGRRAGRH